MLCLLRLAALALLLLPGVALAQSSPNWATGTVPTAAQWNAAFAAKQDYNPNAACVFSPCISSIVTQPNAWLSTNAAGTPVFVTTLNAPGLLNPIFSGSVASGILGGSFSILTSGQLSTSNTAASTSATTGAVVDAGGLGVGGAIWGSGGLVEGSPAGGNEGAGSINAGAIYVNGVAVGTGSGNMVGPASSTAHNLVTFADTGGKNTEDATTATIGSGAPMALTNTTASTSATTGALVVTGGLGVGGALNLTGTEGIAGAIASSNTTASTSDTTGAITTQGGIGVVGNLNVGGNGMFLGNLTVDGSFIAPAPTEGANTVYAGPASGGMAAAGFRSLTTNDLPPVTPSGASIASSLSVLLGRTLTPMDFGAVGNGVADDTAAVQGCVNASATSGWPCYFDSTHKYLITSQIFSAASPIIVGDTPPLSPYSTSCPAGIIVNSNISAIVLQGPTGTVRGLCIQMATAAGTRTGGVAIAAGATASTQQGNVRIADNTIIFPYAGIVIGGPTTGATQTNNDMALRNVIISPSAYGIEVGPSSTGGSTNGATLVDNQIACFADAGAAVGIQIGDAGGFKLDNGPNGPYGCYKGTVVYNTTGQQALGVMSGVLGDSSIADDVILYNGGGSIFYIQMSHCWASGVTSADVPVDIDASSGQVKDVAITDCIFHSGGNGSGDIVHINNADNITLTGNQIVADGGGTTATGLHIGVAAAGLNVTGNMIGVYNGTLTTGVLLDSGATNWCMQGNTNLANTPVTNNSGHVSSCN